MFFYQNCNCLLQQQVQGPHRLFALVCAQKKAKGLTVRTKDVPQVHPQRNLSSLGMSLFYKKHRKCVESHNHNKTATSIREVFFKHGKSCTMRTCLNQIPLPTGFTVSLSIGISSTLKFCLQEVINNSNKTQVKIESLW